MSTIANLIAQHNDAQAAISRAKEAVREAEFDRIQGLIRQAMIRFDGEIHNGDLF